MGLPCTVIPDAAEGRSPPNRTKETLQTYGTGLSTSTGRLATYPSPITVGSGVGGPVHGLRQGGGTREVTRRRHHGEGLGSESRVARRSGPIATLDRELSEVEPCARTLEPGERRRA